MRHLSPRELCEGTAPLLMTRKDMLSRALEMGVCFHRGPAFGGTWRDAPLLGRMTEWKIFIMQGIMWNLRDIKNGPVNGTDLSLGALLGKLDGVRLLGLL